MARYDLLIRNVDILQSDAAATVLLNHDLAIAAGKIAAIAPAIDPGLAGATIDGQGMLATPGMVNAHAHTAMVMLRGSAEDVPIERWFNEYIWPMETNLDEDDIYWGTLLGLAEMIEAGITCVADHYFAMNRVAQAFESTGMRGLLAWAMFSGPTEAVSLERSAAFVDRWQGAADGRIRTCLGPHAPYTCTPDFLTRSAECAAELGVPIHIHLSESAGQVDQSRALYGKTPVAHLRDCGLFEVPTIAAHVGHPQDDDLDILAAHGVAVVATPKTEMKLAIGVTPATELLDRGLTLALGSDGAASGNSADILEEARLLALLEKARRADAEAMTIARTLPLMSRAGAKALGLEGVTGELRVGLQADLVLFRRNMPRIQPIHNPAANLLYSSSSADVDTVIVAGRLLLHERRLLTIDKARVLQEVAARAERLTRQSDRRMAHYPIA
ncbi:MAG: amidohydrolase family protein [Oscillochloris sp.]|nr:amidohydrolase family protein [Oscillochloris sp.]